MKIVIISFVILIILIYIFRKYIEKKTSQTLYFIPDSYGAIQALNSNGLLAVIYRDRTIDWMDNPSFAEIIKIKSVSDRFEEEFDRLLDERDDLCH